ncbi:hypothetical protein Tco_1210628 [Tanacetum coccineum]
MDTPYTSPEMLTKKGMFKKAPNVLATRQGRIKKNKPQVAYGKGKCKGKLANTPKKKTPLLERRSIQHRTPPAIDAESQDTRG